MRARGNRLKAAATGFGVAVTPLFVAAVFQLIILPQISGKIGGIDNKEHAWLISRAINEWPIWYAFSVIIIACYWSIVAIFGGDKLLQSRSANITLTLFILDFLAFNLFSEFFRFSSELQGLCPLLSISTTDGSPFGFEDGSSCGAFTQVAHGIIFLGLFGSSMLFLVASAVIRIASTRCERLTHK